MGASRLGSLSSAAWTHLYLFGLLYFLPGAFGACILIFLPMSGAGYFGLRKGPMFSESIYLLVDLPFGIVTALAARAIIREGVRPMGERTVSLAL